VIGVEPDNAAVARLVGDGRPFDGAAALVVESPASARARCVPVRAWIGRAARARDVAACLAGLGGGRPQVWYVPDTGGGELAADLLAGVPREDLARTAGPASGALGVLQCVAAAGRLASGAADLVYAVAGAAGDAFAGLALERAP
jgi:3-oxoacyl-[acyl-carrier-protein] synthase II